MRSTPYEMPPGSLGGEQSATSGPGKGTSSVYKASFNFINSIVGAGLIGMPYAFGECGLLGGMILLLFVAWLVSQSVQMLIQCGVKENKLDYEALADHLLGKKGYYAALISMFLFAYGAQVAYLVIIGDTVPALIGMNREVVIALVAIFLILPISLLKDMGNLSFTSLAAITADVLIIILVVWTAPSSAKEQNLHPSLRDGTLSLISPRFFGGVGAVSFMFVCMHNSFIVFRSLSEPTLANWKLVVTGSITTCVVLATIFGVSGYLAFGTAIQGDILRNFVTEQRSIDWARGFLAVCMLFVYPLEMFVSRHCLISLINDAREGPKTAGYAEAGTELTGASNPIIAAASKTEHATRAGFGKLSRTDSGRNGAYNQQYISACVTDDEGADEDSETDEVIEFPHSLDYANELHSLRTDIAGSGSGSAPVGVVASAAASAATSRAASFASASSSSSSSSSSAMERGAGGDRDLANPAPTRTTAGDQAPSLGLATACRALGVEGDSQHRLHVAVTLVLWTSTTILAIIFDDLGVVLSLTGSIAASCLGYILPAVIYLHTYKQEYTHAKAAVFDSHASNYEPTARGKLEALHGFYVAFLLIIFGSIAACFGVITVVSGKE